MKKLKLDYELRTTHSLTKKFLQIITYPGILLITTIFSIIKLLIPFWKYNNLYTWDMAGQLFNTWFLKEYIYPAIIGWNPFFYAGYPQNHFYPPLFSYISSTLSFVFSIENSIKILVTIIILLTPISIYYFLRSLEIQKTKASLITGIVYCALYFIRPEYAHFGGDFYSTFNVGLFSNALGFVLVFFYLGTLIAGLKKEKYILPSILFTLLILSHIFSAVFAAIIGASILFIRFLKNRKKTFIFSVKHYLMTFGLSAFWTLPFLFKINNSVTNKSSLNPFIFYVILTVATILIIKLFITKKLNEDILEIAFASAILSALIIIVYEFTNIPLHHYRFIFLTFVLFIIMLFYFMDEHNIFLQGFISVALLFLLFTFPNLQTEGTLSPSLNFSFNASPAERIYIIAKPTEQINSHQLQHQITKEYRANSLKGLYVESTPTSVFVIHLEKQIDEKAMHWGIDINYDLITANLSKDVLETQLKYLNINKIISTKNKTGVGIETQAIQATFYSPNYQKTFTDFYLYELNNTSLIEVLNKKPYFVETNNWINESLYWFMSENITKTMLVFEKVPDNIGTGHETIKLNKITPTNNEIEFFVDSEQDVPIIIKISYFPNWKAYSENKSIKIYRTSPNIMLIYGHGDITLKYELLTIDKISYTISIITAIILTYLSYLTFSRKTKDKKHETKRE